ncbi:hypothetical protein EYF80_004844 [Liparis tanakae]|uniref:Uncharacterized protein n=1 Tax=Liparis tanakae TaxID=230148 RepID=A0A4Z2J3I8_9TELE|nr:hypothetical protein EYF80_004844 [Liparis tanakae]
MLGRLCTNRLAQQPPLQPRYGEQRVFNVYFSVVSFWLSNHIWLFRLVSSQLISQLIDAAAGSAPGSRSEPFSRGICEAACAMLLSGPINPHSTVPMQTSSWQQGRDRTCSSRLLHSEGSCSHFSGRKPLIHEEAVTVKWRRKTAK